jgi:hypothetical protein
MMYWPDCRTLVQTDQVWKKVTQRKHQTDCLGQPGFERARATAVVRVGQNKYKIDPNQDAAGHGEYVPTLIAPQMVALRTAALVSMRLNWINA